MRKYKKYLSKFGLIKTGVVIIAFLIDSKECLASSVHFTSKSFLNMHVIYLVSSAKFAINLLMKFMVPRKDWISFLDLGRDNF